MKMDEDYEDESSDTECYIGITDFSQIVKSDGFVDKTLLLKELLQRDLMALITAPCGYGKSTNMDMVKKFVEIQVSTYGDVIDRKESSNRKIFEDNHLSVVQKTTFFEKYFASYPVIHVGFEAVDGNNIEEVLDMFRVVLHKSFEQHRYLLYSPKLDPQERSIFERYLSDESYRNLTVADIELGLQSLSKYLYKHFDNKKVFVLIDDYDAPFNNTMCKENIHMDAVNKLLSGIFFNTLRENEYVERALLSGISYYVNVGVLGLSNVNKCLFMDNHPFVSFYGLTPDEIVDLLCKFEIDFDTIVKFLLYCEGYGTKEQRLYPVSAILHFLEEGELKDSSGSIIDLDEDVDAHITRHARQVLFGH